jgi:hypothetical protein
MFRAACELQPWSIEPKPVLRRFAMFKKILIAGAVVLSCSTFASATTYSVTQNNISAGASLNNISLDILTSGLFDETFSWGNLFKIAGRPKSGSLTLTFELFNSHGTEIDSGSIGYINTGAGATNHGGTLTLGGLLLSRGNYTLDLSTGSQLSATSATYALTSVPGPIAGVGAPLILMAAFLAFLRRKNVDATQSY